MRQIGSVGKSSVHIVMKMNNEKVKQSITIIRLVFLFLILLLRLFFVPAAKVPPVIIRLFVALFAINNRKTKKKRKQKWMIA